VSSTDADVRSFVGSVKSVVLSFYVISAPVKEPQTPSTGYPAQPYSSEAHARITQQAPRTGYSNGGSQRPYGNEKLRTFSSLFYLL